MQKAGVGLSYLLLTFLIVCKSYGVEIVGYPIPPAVIDTALSYQNVIEIGNNRGAMADKFNKKAGVVAGSPWCQSFVYYCMSANGLSEFKTAHANTYYNNLKKKYGAKQGNIANKIGIITWKYPNSSSGHIGFILKQQMPQYVHTIEGNTSWDNTSPDGRLYAGKQGVFIKIRRIGKLGTMDLRGVVQ